MVDRTPTVSPELLSSRSPTIPPHSGYRRWLRRMDHALFRLERGFQIFDCQTVGHRLPCQGVYYIAAQRCKQPNAKARQQRLIAPIP
jgi:hypothetical protein